MKGPSKQVRYIILGCIGLQETKPSAYWAHAWVMNKMKCREYELESQCLFYFAENLFVIV